MTKHNISFVAPIQNSLGYGEFARGFVYALNQRGFNVSVEPINLENKVVDHGLKGKVCNLLINKKIKPKYNIICMIPRFFPLHKKSDCKNIGFTMFEASKLPEGWANACNQMDAIFAPSKWNKEVFESSGVKAPVFVVSPGIDLPDLNPPNFKEKYVFYSIGQWTARKNFHCLVKAYLEAFGGETDVKLVIKTYRKDYSEGEQQIIKDELKEWTGAELDNPCIELVLSQYSRAALNAKIHQPSDCFVLPTRAEGWGLPFQEAMAWGKPAIGTRYSSHLDFMNDDNSRLINYKLAPVSGMLWLSRFYTDDMLWAEPDIRDLQEKMLWAYNNRDKARDLGLKGRESLKEQFSWENSILSLKQALDEV